MDRRQQGRLTNKEHRSRLFGKGFRGKGENNELFASTPPLEAFRAVISHAATTLNTASMERRKIIVNDVRRAYFNAKATRDIYIELPEEDDDYGNGMMSKLALCLYGTRHAPVNWQESLSLNLV